MGRIGECAQVGRAHVSSRNIQVNSFETAPCQRSIPGGFIETLRERLGDRVVTSVAAREHHGRDESPYPPMLPDAVVYALTTEEVAWVAAQCNKHSVPLIAYGAGSSLEGHL